MKFDYYALFLDMDTGVLYLLISYSFSHLSTIFVKEMPIRQSVVLNVSHGLA